MGLVDKIFKAIDHPAFEVVLFGAAVYNLLNDREQKEEPTQRVANKSLDAIIAAEAPQTIGKSPREVESEIERELSRRYRTQRGIKYNLHKRAKLLEAYYTEIGRDVKKEHAKDFLEILLYGKHPKTIEYEPGNFVTKALYSTYEKLLFKGVSLVF